MTRDAASRHNAAIASPLGAVARHKHLLPGARVNAVCPETVTLQIPSYLHAHYWWAYIHPRAVTLFEETLPLTRELGGQALCALSLIYLGHSASRREDAIVAATHYQEALRICHDTGDTYLLPYALEGWGWATRDYGEGERTAQLYGAAAALRAAIHYVPAPHETTDRERKIEALRETLGAAAFARAWAVGERIPLEQAVANALSEGE